MVRFLIVELPVYDNGSLVTGNKDYMLNYIYDNFYKVKIRYIPSIMSPRTKSLGQHMEISIHIKIF